MLIFQISPPRTGSTWQFNTARELLLLQSTTLKSLYLGSEKNCPEFENKEKENILIKSHNLDASWLLKFSENFEVKVLLSLRNLFDTVRSSRRVGLGESDIDILIGINESLRCLKGLLIGGVSCHLSFIDQLNSENELLQETIRIRDFLGISSENDQIERISSSLSKNSIRNFISNKLELEETFSVYDQTTHWHGNHIEPKNQGDMKELLGFELVSQDSEIRPLHEVIKLENQVINLKNFLSPYTQQRDELTQQRDELTQQRDELTQQRDELTQQRDELTQQRDELTQQRDELTQQRDELTQQRDELTQQRDELTQQRDELTQQRDELTQQRDELTQQRDELTQQRDELTQQRDELTQQRDELTQQRDELTQQRDEIVNSTIWKLTNPLRKAIDLFKK
jgi:predicted  nucleic acid-binding Zn-ribbon protein